MLSANWGVPVTVTASMKLTSMVATSPAFRRSLSAPVALTTAKLVTAGAMATRNTSDTLVVPSLAMTLRLMSRALGGVPLKVRVAALNESQAGNAASLPKVAL